MSRWLIFISFFLSIYGLFHLYLLIKLRRSLYLEGWSYLLIVALLLFMMSAPFQARLLESQNQQVAALVLTWISSLWMGWIFIWVWLALAMDAYHLTIGLTARLLRTEWMHLLLARRQAFGVTIAAAGLLALYAIYEAQQVRLEHLKFNSHKIAAGTEGIRMVQLSDVHIGPMLFPGKLEKIVSAVQAARPDLIVSTGDLIDGPPRMPYDVLRQLNSLTAPLGKYAVTGNHEEIAGLGDSLKFTRAAGFDILRGRSVSIGEELTIVGVDDPATGQYRKSLESALLSESPRERFTLLLKHQPTLNSAGQDAFDLQLSGHTHKGQIMPFGWVVKMKYKIFSGLYETARQSYVYVSRGAGTWGPPMRLFAPSEITVIDLLPSKSEFPVVAVSSCPNRCVR